MREVLRPWDRFRRRANGTSTEVDSDQAETGVDATRYVLAMRVGSNALELT